MADSTTRKATSTSSPTKKSAKKSTTKKSTKSADKTAAKKTAANKSTGTARKTASARAEAPPRERRTHSSDRDSGQDHGRGTQVAARAREAVLHLTGKPAEAVTGLERTDDGWTVEVEVRELERIPSTTDVLAIYEVTVDEDGELQGCRRIRRYLRGSPGDE